MALFYFDRYSGDMLGKTLIIIGLISGVLLTIVINTTTPVTAGAFGILAVFVLTYLVLTSVMTFVLAGVSHLIGQAAPMVAVHRPVETLSLRRAYYFSTIIALAPVIIISMQSVGAVGIYELALITLLVSLGCVYVAKRTA